MSRRISYLVAAASLVGLIQQDSDAQWNLYREKGNSVEVPSPEAEPHAAPDNGLAAKPDAGLNVQQQDIDNSVEKLCVLFNINAHDVAGGPIDLQVRLSYSMKQSRKEDVAQRIGSNQNYPLLKDLLEASASMAFDGNPELSGYLSSGEIKKFEEGRLFLGKKMTASLDKMISPLGLSTNELYISRAKPTAKPYEPDMAKADAGSPENAGYSTLYNSLKTSVRVLTTSGKPVDVEYIIVYSFQAEKDTKPDSEYDIDSNPGTVNHVLNALLCEKTAEIFALNEGLDHYALDGSKRTSGGRKSISTKVMPDFYKKAADSGITVNELIVTNVALVAPPAEKKSPEPKVEEKSRPSSYTVRLASNPFI